MALLDVRSDIDWQYRTGRERDGEKYATWNLVHGSGRILARVLCPAEAGEYNHRAVFYCTVPATILDTSETFDFIDSDSAKAFVEGILSQFDPLAPPQPKLAVAAVAAAPTIGSVAT